jgi:antitoxin ParD1/3/4
MNVSLTPELEELISQKVKSGMYNSASEVIRESLRRMFREDEANKRVITEEQRRQMENLRQEVLKGVEQIRNGEGIVYNSPEELIEDVIKRGTKRLEEKRGNKISL